MDDQNERRRLRAAADRSRTQQRTAAVGFCIAMLCLHYSDEPGYKGTELGILFLIASPLIFIGSLIPFFSVKCPSCRKRFNSVANLFRSANGATCSSCGFNLAKHISRYGSGGSGA